MKIPEFLQATEETDVPIRFLPGYAFFCRSLNLPEEISGTEEVYSFAELSLESLSPFPMEQLTWGYLTDFEARQIFLFAACRPRLPAEQLEGWEEARHVFPSFLPLLLVRPESAEVLGIEDEHTCCFVRYASEGRFPAQVVSAAFPEEAVEEARQTLRQRLLSRLQKTPEADPLLLRLEQSTLNGDGLGFTLATIDDQAQYEARLEDMEAIWSADVRDPDFIVAERKRRQATERVGWVLAGAGGAFALLLLLFVLTWVGGWFVSSREARVTAQTEPALIVQQNSEFLLQLKQFSGEPFKPFAELAAANLVLRERQPRRITFESANLTNNFELSIQGESANVEEVNAYSDRLRASGYFSEVELADVRTRRGKVNFSLNLRFNPDSMDTLLAALEPEPETVAANDNEDNPTEDESDSANP